ncbi:MAG: DUF3307 domain-containing protein [Sphingobacteriales bacterium]|nr:DUF3307 domain-containing protein [Sphingobacteriales bacterium]
MATVWLTKLLLSHLLTDFALQPYSWVRDRKEKHFASIKLYIHGFLHRPPILDNYCSCRFSYHTSRHPHREAN